jgi:hypothetical protein
MPKLEDSAKGEKSFGVMIYEPPYTRPAWPVLTKEGSGGVRGTVATIRSSPVYSISCLGFIFRSVDSVGKDILFCNFGLCVGCSDCKCVWLRRWLFYSLFLVILLFCLLNFQMLNSLHKSYNLSLLHNPFCNLL